jgi:hypothetical protein
MGAKHVSSVFNNRLEFQVVVFAWKAQGNLSVMAVLSVLAKKLSNRLFRINIHNISL